VNTEQLLTETVQCAFLCVAKCVVYLFSVNIHAVPLY